MLVHADLKTKTQFFLAVVMLVALGPTRASAGDLPEKCAALSKGYFLEVWGYSSWEQVHDAFLCVVSGVDDGVVAEGFSDRVGWLLAHRWESLAALQELGVRDPTFSQFVVRHIDITIPADELAMIEANANQRCPAGLAPLCRSLISAVARVGVEAEAAP